MATLSGKFYGQAFLSLFNKEIDVDTDTIKIMLCTSSYTPNQDTHRYKSDVTNEVVGTGYTAGGATLTGVTITYDAVTNTIKIDANDPSWASSSITGARVAVIYDATPGTDATRPLIAYAVSDVDMSTTSGTLSLTFDAAGIATVSVAA